MKLKGWNKCKGYKNKDKKGMGCEEQILGYHGLGKNILAGRGGIWFWTDISPVSL
jgi:hypothetical protein